MTDRQDDNGLLGGVRRAVGEALDATVGRVGQSVGEAALDVTGATAQQVIEDLEPYLIEHAVPRIVAGITPYLSATVVPEVLQGVQDHLIEVTVPEVVDGVTDHLVEVTVPEVVEGITPRLVEQLLPRLLGELRPYLEQELVPPIVESLVPRLAQTVAPDLLEALMPTIEQQVAPQLVDALMPKIEGEVAPRLLEVLMPTIEAEIAPRLVEVLMPTIEQDIAPRLLEVLMPRIEQDIAPRLVDALMPKIEGEVAPRLLEVLMPTIEQDIAPRLLEVLMPTIEQDIAPRLVDSLMPKIEGEVAPRLLEVLMPRIEQDIAPRLVDSLMPKIRTEVVPVLIDDIADDPRVRDLIREQSQGLLLDAVESLRENLADADDLVERLGRRVLRRPPREAAASGVDLVLDATGRGQVGAVRVSLQALEEQRRAWATSPAPPAPPGRAYAHAGIVTRLIGFAVDVSLVGWLVSQGLSALIGLLDALLSPIPQWLTALLSGVAASLVPIYLAISWWLTGRSVGSWLVGIRVCTPDGRNPGLVRALVRSWVGVVGIVVWVLSGVLSLVDTKRRSLLDDLLHTEVRYVVPGTQQHRYIREAVHARRTPPPAQVGGVEPAAEGAQGERAEGRSTGPGPTAGT